MPQLDFSTYPSQLFWFTIFFFSLYLVLKNLVLPKIEIVIRKRYETINKALDNALSFCTITEHEIRNQEQTLQRAQLKALKIINDTVKKAKLLESNMKVLLDNEISRTLDLVDKEVKNYRMESYNQLLETTVSLATIYYQKLVGSHVEDSDKLRVVASSIFKEDSL